MTDGPAGDRVAELSDIEVPEHLYLPRKTFEFGGAVLTRADVEAETGRILSTVPVADDPEVRELDRYWAREQALYEVLAVSRGLRYADYLPGRAHTYRRLAEVLHGLCGGPVDSLVEVGCGSALLAHHAEVRPGGYLAVDISAGALGFAARLAQREGGQINTLRADATRLPLAHNTVRVGASLGLIEHFDHDAQVAIVAETWRVCTDLAIFVVPAIQTAIFQTMSALEREQAGPELGFPLEEHYHAVDFDAIAAACGVYVVARGAFHLALPRRIPTRYLRPAERRLFTELVSAAEDAYRGPTPASAREAWWTAEMSIPPDLTDRHGWFTYAAFGTDRSSGPQSS